MPNHSTSYLSAKTKSFLRKKESRNRIISNKKYLLCVRIIYATCVRKEDSKKIYQMD